LVAKIPPQLLLLLRRLNLQSSWELAQEQQDELHQQHQQQQSGAGIPAALCVFFNYHGVTALITKLPQRFQFYLVFTLIHHAQALVRRLFLPFFTQRD
jgi:hypothetical protein